MVSKNSAKMGHHAASTRAVHVVGHPVLETQFYKFVVLGTHPDEVVQEWTIVYGADQDRASDLTTLKLRKGKPKKAWANETYLALQKIGYRHLSAKVINKKVRVNKAIIVIDALIMTIVGEISQIEAYFLIQQDGKWLIDKIEIGEEIIYENGVVL